MILIQFSGELPRGYLLSISHLEPRSPRADFVSEPLVCTGNVSVRGEKERERQRGEQQHGMGAHSLELIFRYSLIQYQYLCRLAHTPSVKQENRYDACVYMPKLPQNLFGFFVDASACIK